jgi:hypothetical protein
MARHSYTLPTTSWPCPKGVCVYNVEGQCEGSVRINHGNGDAACHRLGRKGTLIMLGLLPKEWRNPSAWKSRSVTTTRGDR